jgi:hypothetical protein
MQKKLVKSMSLALLFCLFALQAHAVERIDTVAAEKMVREYIFAQNPKMNPAAKFPLIELTTEELFQRLKCQIFQITPNVFPHPGVTYLISGSAVRQLGVSGGDSKVMSFCVADLDGNGRYELLYVYSFGSGIYRSHVAMYRPLEGKIQEAKVPFAYMMGDLSLNKVNDKTVMVDAYAFPRKNPTSKKLATLGQLELKTKGDTIALDILLSDSLPEEVLKAIWRQ